MFPAYTPCTCIRTNTPLPMPPPPRRNYVDCIAQVEIRAEYVDDTTNRQKVIYTFTPQRFRFVNRIELKGANLMTPEDIEAITSSCLPTDANHLVDVSLVDKFRGKVEAW